MAGGGSESATQKEENRPNSDVYTSIHVYMHTQIDTYIYMS